MSTDRRSFLKAAGTALGAAAVGTGCAPNPASDREDAAASTSLDGGLLRAVAVLVLPAELSPVEQEEAVQGFERWAAGYEPVAELNHGYGTSEIRYGPPDPRPGWAAQLRGLDLEAQRRSQTGFAALERTEADPLLRGHLAGARGGLGAPLQAEHVALALLGWWLSTPDATDRCYGVRIAPQTCRGIDTAPAEPEAIL
ncbi:MAG: twin-arginine translocation signal domain-containing protein [Gemmatimonadota bacterium]